MKKILLILILFIGFTLASCESEKNETDDDRVVEDRTSDDNKDNDDDRNDDDRNDNELIQITIEELAMYDGTEGNPAYIAVDGVIYDVSDSTRWSGGSHNGFTAGQDLSAQIKTISPHGLSVLDGIPIVGEIIE
jgi:predicted heme/steroid binding protein